MFTPFRLRELELRNRVVVSPMDMYSAVDGMPERVPSRPSRRARARRRGAGLHRDDVRQRRRPHNSGVHRNVQPEHAAGWKRIVDFVHEWSGAKICLQLGHSRAQRLDEADVGGHGRAARRRQLAGGRAVGDSPTRPQNQVPRELTRAEMDAIREEFVRAARMGARRGLRHARAALRARLSALEFHHAAAQSAHRRIRRIARRTGCAIRSKSFARCAPCGREEKPMSVRISATDWVDGGITGDDAVEIARAFKAAGADLIDVSTGQTSREAQTGVRPHVPNAVCGRIRNEIGIATMAVGNIYEPDHVNSIIAAGRADLCAIGRPHLADPNWTLHAAAQLGYTDAAWPVQYLPGKAQLERNLARAAEVSSHI